MFGRMMDVPLTVTSMLRHAATNHAGVAVMSRNRDGSVHRSTYGVVYRRSQQVAHALGSFGLQPGDRVGTLGWNSVRHLELYFGISGAGLVCHTINPRLFPDQIAYVIRHAADAVLFVDPEFVGLLDGIAGALDGVKAVVVMADGMVEAPASLPVVIGYEDLLSAQPEGYAWPDLDERTAAALCYTSGTTGDPKGVLYSHRSSVLHAMSVCMPDVFGIARADVVMPVVPMFHVAAWGMPYAAPLAGATLVLPGPRLDGASLHDLILREGVTCTAGVPTVWNNLLDWADANGASLAPLGRVGIGGSACPAALAERFERRDIEVIHAWGMTETSPVALCNRLPPTIRALTPAERARHAAPQGRPLFGIETRVVDDTGAAVPADGAAFGALLVRGPWVASGYVDGDERDGFSIPGWFATGDVATIDPDGAVRIVDRIKDVIKSGGEWISSIQIENIAASHPAVREVAAVAMPDPHWGERPMLLVVLRDGATATREDLLACFVGRVARWAVPERIDFVASLPHTATGKVSKREIRKGLL